MDDPGWGEYVPLPKDADGQQSPPPGGAGPRPPTAPRPWWRRNIILVVAAVLALGITGGTVMALANRGGSGSGSGQSQSPAVTTSVRSSITDVHVITTPVSPSISTGRTSADPFVAFAARANAICSRFRPVLVHDFTSGSASLLQDTKNLINALLQLGTSPSSGSSWQEGLQDWQQAASFLADLGDPQDWQINIWAGAHLFRDMGIQACGSYGSIGQ